MNRDFKALIDAIEVDEHLAHYQKLTYSQRADLLSQMAADAYSVKRPAGSRIRQKKLEDRKFTPMLCRQWLRRMSLAKD